MEILGTLCLLLAVLLLIRALILVIPDREPNDDILESRFRRRK
jgi:hypothetical protein